MATTLEDKIKAQEAIVKAQQTKLAQIKAQFAKKTAAAKAKELGEARKMENRKKVLIGAYVLAQMEKDGIGAAILFYGSNQSFSDWLTRPDERELFGLPVIAPTVQTLGTVSNG